MTADISETGPLTHEELVVVSDILGRVGTAARNGGDTNLLKVVARFALRPEFATALKKIDDATIATSPGQSWTQ